MFIRAKTISGKRYAYLVRTKWNKKSKKVCQKVSKYLGKIIPLDKVKDIDFFEYYTNYELDKYLESVKIEGLVNDLVELELFRHGFTKKPGSKYQMVNGIMQINIENFDKVFELNEGFLNKFTLREILRYHKILDHAEKDIPYKFAGLFVNAGLSIDKELFVELYQKFFSDNIISKNREKYSDESDEEKEIDFYY